MSINQAYGVDPKIKTNKLGKFYWDIDFEMNQEISEADFSSNEQCTIGTLEIGGKSIPLTFSECNKIIETLEDAKHTHRQIYKLGLTKR